MASLEWDRCLQFAIPTFGVAVTSFVGSWRAAQQGGSTTWQSVVLLAVSAAFLITALVLTGLAIVRHPGSKRWLYWKVILAVAVTVAVALTCFGFFNRLTEFGQGLFFGAGALIILEGARRLVLEYLHRRPKPPEPTTAEPKAHQESILRLDEVFRGCQPAITYAIEYLCHDLCLHTQNQDQKFSCDLINQYALRECSKDYYVLETTIAAAVQFSTTAAGFDEIVQLFCRIINVHYLTVTGLILRLGGSMMGQDHFLGSEGLAGLRKRHANLVQEIRRVKGRPDIGGIANWSQTLADLLPPPPQSLS